MSGLSKFSLVITSSLDTFLSNSDGAQFGIIVWSELDIWIEKLRKKLSRKFLIVKKSKSNMQALEKLPLAIDSNVLIHEKGSDFVKIFEAYKIASTMPTTVQQVGTWSELSRLKMTTRHIWERREDLQEFSIEVSAVNVSQKFINGK